LLTALIVLRVFCTMPGLWAKATLAASAETRIAVVAVIAGFIVSPYFFAGAAGVLAGPAGSRSWLKYVVVMQVATTLSPGAY
jgi:hypothetical protein